MPVGKCCCCSETLVQKRLFRNACSEMFLWPRLMLKNQVLREGQAGQHLSYFTCNLVVYFAAEDLAMVASKAANPKHRRISWRLGMTGPEDIKVLPKNVDGVDGDNFGNSFEWLRGHAYFLSDPVIKHFTTVVSAARASPNQRSYKLSK